MVTISTESAGFRAYPQIKEYTLTPSAMVAGRRERMAKSRLESWEVSDAFWKRVEPLIPQRRARPTKRKYERKPGGWTQAEAAAAGVRSHCVRAAHGLPVEGLAQ